MSGLVIRVCDFGEFPGPRYRSLGGNSGEEFREDVLLPALRNAMATGAMVIVDLDGVYGYGSSFLEEAFGGLIRAGVPSDDVIALVKNLKSNDDPSLVDEIGGYVSDAIEERGNGA